MTDITPDLIRAVARRIAATHCTTVIDQNCITWLLNVAEDYETRENATTILHYVWSEMQKILPGVPIWNDLEDVERNHLIDAAVRGIASFDDEEDA